MKASLLSIIAFFGINFSYATIHNIDAMSGNIFSPQVTNAVVGDTIQWTLVSGVHTTESTTIPSGAASWSSGNLVSGTPYKYVVTKAGTYNYDCHHASTGGAGHGMSGSIVVASPTGMLTVNQSQVLTVYPNPFKDNITVVTTQQETISVYTITGEKIMSLVTSDIKTIIDLSKFPSGVYILQVSNNDVVSTKKIIKE